MTIDRQALESMNREGLLAEAYRHGVKRAEVMTRVELTDEIVRLGTPDPVERKEVRGWLGVARDLVASIVDKGLNLPDAAAVIRGDARFEPLKQRPHAPVATVTLAEIYGAQGHYARAIAMLDEVLEKESDHHVARRLRDRLVLVSDSRRGVAPEASASGQPAEPEPAFRDSLEADELPDEDDDTATTLPPRGVHAVHVNGASFPDEDGTLSTLPPLESAVVPLPIVPEVVPEDDGDTLPTLPPVAMTEPPDSENGTSPLPVDDSSDEDGTALTLPPMNGVSAASGAAGGGGHTAFEDDADDAPKTLAPAQLPAMDEPPPALSQLENPVRRVAPSDIDWEPLPQTELAPNLVVEAPEGTDALIVLRTGDATASLYFELGTAPSHTAVLRVVELRPRRAFAERVERELPVTSKGGLVTIEDLERGSIVRAAIGVREGDLFRALAVAAEVRATERGPEVVWAPRKQADYGAVARNAALVLPQLRA
jgi:hypothetical protein